MTKSASIIDVNRTLKSIEGEVEFGISASEERNSPFEKIEKPMFEIFNGLLN